MSSGYVFQQTVGISMGTNCAPLIILLSLTFHYIRKRKEILTTLLIASIPLSFKQMSALTYIKILSMKADSK